MASASFTLSVSSKCKDTVADVLHMNLTGSWAAHFAVLPRKARPVRACLPAHQRYFLRPPDLERLEPDFNHCTTLCDGAVMMCCIGQTVYVRGWHAHCLLKVVNETQV